MIVLATMVAASAAAQEARPGATPRQAAPPFEVPRLETVKRVARPGRLSPREAMTSCYILQTTPHPVSGKAYVIVTDHNEAAYLEPLERLARHHAGTIVRLDDLGALSEGSVRADLAGKLLAAQPRYVAVAPRLESFRENMLLGLWDVLGALDDDPELDALPGVLVAPDAASFAALVDRSISYRPTPRAGVHPFVISQLLNVSPNGSRSLQKLAILRERFGQLGIDAPGLVVRQFPGAEPRLEASDIWEARTRGPFTLLAELPTPAALAIEDASLLIMFGHGTPGMTCGVRVEAFEQVRLTGKVILCGSCMSVAPTRSDFPTMAVGPDGSEVVADRKRFLMEAVGRGAVAAYGHMRLNGGFPHLYPVLDALLQGESVGEAYQRLIDGLLGWTQLSPGQLVLAQPGAANGPAVLRRNQLLYVFVGDPALRPLVPLDAHDTQTGNAAATGSLD
jgi:hypothetical protein